MCTIIGIDLGTTTSEIAYVKDGKPEVIINELGGRITPSVVGLTDENEIMMITSGGIIIRMPVNGISKIGRYTSGVKLMNIDVEKDIKVASIAKVRETETEEMNQEMDGQTE